MFEAPCGPERASIDRSRLVDVGPPLRWALRFESPLRTIAVRLDGTDDGAYNRLVDLAELALPGLAALEVAADAYLRSWIDPAAHFLTGTWRVRSLWLTWDALPEELRGHELELRLAITGDDYGEWCVRFKYHSSPSPKLAAYAFARRQW